MESKFAKRFLTGTLAGLTVPTGKPDDFRRVGQRGTDALTGDEWEIVENHSADCQSARKASGLSPETARAIQPHLPAIVAACPACREGR